MSMNSEAHQKITAAHLSRMAYLYVRQSTIRQVFENTESTTRQYGLRERAVALGGDVTVGSRRPHGTHIHVRLPAVLP